MHARAGRFPRHARLGFRQLPNSTSTWHLPHTAPSTPRAPVPCAPEHPSPRGTPGAPRTRGEVLIGAHMSVAGGVSKAVDRAVVHGCEALQIFAKNANQWRGKPLDPDEMRRFRRGLDATGIGTGRVARQLPDQSRDRRSRASRAIDRGVRRRARSRACARATRRRHSSGHVHGRARKRTACG